MATATKQLRLVQVPGAGLDKIDLSALPEGVFLSNVYGHETGVAEYVFGGMLTLSRNLYHLDDALRRGIWHSQFTGKPPPVWCELAGKTLGILGYGRIGHAIARRAAAFEMKVCALSRTDRQCAEDWVDLRQGRQAFEDILQKSDYLTITLPLSPDTRGLIGPQEIAMMKSTAILINVARGEIVEEHALYNALKERKIAAAAIDVWYRYPQGSNEFTFPATCEFQSLSNVLMTPHVSAWTDGMLDARARLIAQNIGLVARGKLPMNLIER